MNTVTMIDADGSTSTISADGELFLGDLIALEAKIWIGPFRLYRGQLGPLEVGRATRWKHVPSVVSITGVMFPSLQKESRPTFPGSCLNESDYEGDDSEGETELAEAPQDPAPVKLGKGYVMGTEPETLQDVYRNLDQHLSRKRTSVKREFFEPVARTAKRAMHAKTKSISGN
jgi:hypothetical protein